MSGYTKIDNWLLDVVMPNVDGSTFKIIMAIARKTNGWGKNSDVISVRQFQRLAGISGRSNVLRAIDRAIESGLVARTKQGRSFRYELVIGHESVPIGSEDGSRIGTDNGHESVPMDGHESRPTKETTKDNIKILQKHFEHNAGILPGRSGYESDWQAPLAMMLEKAGGLEKAKARMTKALEVARGANEQGKRYTVRNPLSIQTIFANLETGDQVAGVITR